MAVQRAYEAAGAVPRVSRLDHSGWSAMREKMSAKPSKSPQVTKPPTSRKATSLTMDSTATADMSPVCSRVKSRLRAPKRMPKRASMAATSRAGSNPESTESPPIIMANDTDTALSWSAMYGIIPHTTRTATSVPSGRRLAVAAGDEVRDRRDPLLLGHPHQLAQHRRPEEGHQGRPEVDGQELEAPIGGQAHAAVERPRRAVDGDGEDVGEGLQASAGKAPPEALGHGGDEEQEDQVADEDGRERRGAHGGSSPGDARAAQPEHGHDGRPHQRRGTARARAARHEHRPVGDAEERPHQERREQHEAGAEELPGSHRVPRRLTRYACRCRRATPVLHAAAATAAATAGTTRESNIDGVMYSSLSSLLVTMAARACAAASFISSLTRRARTSSMPRKKPGEAAGVVDLVRIVRPARWPSTRTCGPASSGWISGTGLAMANTMGSWAMRLTSLRVTTPGPGEPDEDVGLRPAHRPRCP